MEFGNSVFEHTDTLSGPVQQTAKYGRGPLVPDLHWGVSMHWLEGPSKVCNGKNESKTYCHTSLRR